MSAHEVNKYSHDWAWNCKTLMTAFYHNGIIFIPWVFKEEFVSSTYSIYIHLTNVKTQIQRLIICMRPLFNIKMFSSITKGKTICNDVQFISMPWRVECISSDTLLSHTVKNSKHISHPAAYILLNWMYII